MDQRQTPASPWKRHRDELFIALQRLLPQHGCSRLLGKLAESETPWLKNWLIQQAMGHYGIDLAEAEESDPRAYRSFNHFFTRRLKADARPIDTNPAAIASPADGAISQIGAVREGRIFQAKGHDFSTATLLGCNAQTASRFSGGSFATIYLSPRDYHRVHMPVSGTLVETRYIPGNLFSVNDTTANHVDSLFARNERLSCIFKTEQGLVAVVLVGALFVAGIETRWQKSFAPGKPHSRRFDGEVSLAKGEELGAFKFGSTAIVVSEKPVTWNPDFNAESICRMGEAMGLYSEE